MRRGYDPKHMAPEYGIRGFVHMLSNNIDVALILLSYVVMILGVVVIVTGIGTDGFLVLMGISILALLQVLIERDR